MHFFKIVENLCMYLSFLKYEFYDASYWIQFFELETYLALWNFQYIFPYRNKPLLDTLVLINIFYDISSGIFRPS